MVKGLEAIDGTPVLDVEGTWGPGRMVVIEFPDAQAARDWYASPAYQEILPLRTRNCETGMILVEGL